MKGMFGEKMSAKAKNKSTTLHLFTVTGLHRTAAVMPDTLTPQYISAIEFKSLKCYIATSLGLMC